MVNTSDLKPPSPWIPISDPVQLAQLGKLMEELSECISAASRCMIQGFDEREPVTGKLNSEWLAEELADVTATMVFVENFLEINQSFHARVGRKIEHLRQWYAMVERQAQK